MNIHRKLKKTRALIFSLGLLALSPLSSASLFPLNLAVSNSDIQVGDIFDLDVAITFDNQLELSSFSFAVDPLNTLSSDGVLSFQSWFVSPSLMPSLFPSPDLVEGMGDPFNPRLGGIDIQIATLTFEAIGAGTTNVSLFGEQNDWNGISFYDLDNNSISDFDIDSSIQVSVNGSSPSPVPNVSNSLSMLSISLFTLILIRKKLKAN